MSAGHRLLLDESPLVVLPQLAVKVGLNEAIVLQQVHYWLVHNRKTGQNVVDDQVWTYNPLPKWLEQFPFWSERTLWQIFTNLRKADLLIAAQLSPDKRDRTLWYTIDYDRLGKRCELDPEAAGCTSQDLRDANSQNLRDVNKEQRLAAETTAETKKNVVVQPSAAATQEDTDLLPSSERRSAASRGGYELKLAGDAWAQRAFRAASGDAAALQTACLCVDAHPDVWTWLVKGFEKYLRDPGKFRNLLDDVAQDLRHRSPGEVASDLKQSFENTKGSFLGYYRTMKAIPHSERKPARGFSRSSRRRGGAAAAAEEAARLEHARSYREQALAESMAAFGGKA